MLFFDVIYVEMLEYCRSGHIADMKAGARRRTKKQGGNQKTTNKRKHEQIQGNLNAYAKMSQKGTKKDNRLRIRSCVSFRPMNGMSQLSSDILTDSSLVVTLTHVLTSTLNNITERVVVWLSLFAPHGGPVRLFVWQT